MSSAEGLLHPGKMAGQTLRAFYSRPLGWFALVVTSLTVSYVGGGVMFWFHAIYRGEQGPAINDVVHWFFDSSLGFAALTPALLFILPAALLALDRTHVRGERMKATIYVGIVGVLFGVVTGPGPFMHDTLVGRAAPLGRLAVRIFGYDPAAAARVADAAHHSPVTEGLLQVLVGVPVYIATGLIALTVVRAVARRSHA